MTGLTVGIKCSSLLRFDLSNKNFHEMKISYIEGRVQQTSLKSREGGLRLISTVKHLFENGVKWTRLPLQGHRLVCPYSHITKSHYHVFLKLSALYSHWKYSHSFIFPTNEMWNITIWSSVLNLFFDLFDIHFQQERKFPNNWTFSLHVSDRPQITSSSKLLWPSPPRRNVIIGHQNLVLRYPPVMT